MADGKQHDLEFTARTHVSAWRWCVNWALQLGETGVPGYPVGITLHEIRDLPAYRATDSSTESPK